MTCSLGLGLNCSLGCSPPTQASGPTGILSLQHITPTSLYLERGGKLYLEVSKDLPGIIQFHALNLTLVVANVQW
jgi:hypothetical protein